MINVNVGLEEAAEKLKISISSLMKNLRDGKYTFGFHAVVNGKDCFFINREIFERELKEGR